MASKEKGKEEGGKSVPIYEQIKAAGARRYGNRSISYDRYIDLAMNFLMGGDGKLRELRANFDALQKSDSKIMANIILDFQILECIQLWSDVITLVQLERKDEFYVTPAR